MFFVNSSNLLLLPQLKFTLFTQLAGALAGEHYIQSVQLL